jgi:kinesin family protein 18/19
MVATISAAADQYHHSVNTLKYADRAKEIKTHVVQNVRSVERHITDYQNIIDNLQVASASRQPCQQPPFCIGVGPGAGS